MNGKVIALMLALSATGALPAHAQALDGFIGWTASKRDANNSIATAPVTSFGKSTQAVHMRVSEGSAASPFIARKITDSGKITISCDVCINSETTYRGGDGVFVLRVFDKTGSNDTLIFTGNDTIMFGGDPKPVTDFKRGVWYRLRLTLPPPSSGGASLTIQPEGGTAQTLPLTGWGPFSLGGAYASVHMQTGFGARPVTDILIANIELSGVDAMSEGMKKPIAREKPMVVASTMHCFMLGSLPMQDQEPGTAVSTNTELVEDWNYWPQTDKTYRPWFSKRIVGELNSGVQGMTIELDNAKEAGIDALGILISGHHVPQSKFTPTYRLLAKAAESHSVKIFPDLWTVGNPSNKYDYATNYGQGVKALMDEYPNAFMKVGDKFVIGLGCPLNYGLALKEKMGAWTWDEFKPFFDAWGNTNSFYFILDMFHYEPADLEPSGWGSVFNTITFWGARLGWGDMNGDIVMDTAQKQYAKPIMWPLNSSYYTSGHRNPNMAETLGLCRFIDQWRKALAYKANHLMIQTWNDFGEDHAVSECNLRGKTLMEMIRYFSDWLKGGSAPAPAQEKIFLFHHRQLVDATITESTRRGHDSDWHVTPVSDYLHVVTILKSPAKLTLTLGGLSWESKQVPAGLHEWLVYVPSKRTEPGTNKMSYVRSGSYPVSSDFREVTIAERFEAGVPEASVVRGVKTVFSVKSHVPLVDTIRFENLAMVGTMAAY
ncbi:MAG: endo-1,3-alpha-glucanase family glycosylhydrolase [Spirochaetota bacterium]